MSITLDENQGVFGELVLGPPGSGKTTYCEGKRQFLSVYDPCRPIVIVNLDPANDSVYPYPCDVSICDFILHADAMAEHKLGPNGSYLYCAQYILDCGGVEWLVEQVSRYLAARTEEARLAYPPQEGNPIRAPHLIIDCPGQVEFYVNSEAMRKIVIALQKELRCNLCAIHLVDSIVATRNVPSYVSACLLSLSTMVDLELPHVNVLTKWEALQGDVEAQIAQVDAIAAQEDAKDFEGAELRAAFRYELQQGDFYRNFLHPGEFLSLNLQRIWRMMDAASFKTRLTKSITKTKIYSMSNILAEVVNGYGIVGFEPLDIQNQDLMLKLTQRVDNAVGNMFI